MFSYFAVVDDNIVNNTLVPRQVGKGLIHPPVVVLRNGRDTIRGSQIHESANGCDEHSEELAFFIKGALVVSFDGIKLRKHLHIF